MKKIGIVLLIMLMLPVFVCAGSFSSDVSKANNYLQRDAFSSSYKKYLLYSSLKFGFENGASVSNSSFTMGGFISEGEYKLTIPNKGSSYLLTGDAYWTLTRDGSKYKVIEYNGSGSNELSSYESNSTRPKARVTEYVAPNTSVSGTGKKNDPWIFDPMFRVDFEILGGHATINGSSEDDGKKLSNIYLRAKCKESECTKTITLTIEDGYNFISDTCDGSYNYERNEYTVNNITKDMECKLTIGIGKFHVNLVKGDWEETRVPSPDNVYLRQRENYYRENTYTNIIYKLDTNPERYGYTFKGYNIKDTTIKIIDDTGKFIDKTSIKKNNQEIISDWQKNIYTLTFNPNGGTINASETTKQVTFDEAYGLLPLATRAGYSFKGWFTSASNNEQIKSTDIVKYAGNRTLYAQWTICSVGKYNTGNSTTCTSCPTGYTSAQGSTAENQCYMKVPSGKYLVSKDSSALPCEKGTSRNGEVKRYYGESVSCSNCNAEYYQDETGQTSCKKCPTGYTSSIKATADTACFMKVSPGYYLVAKASSTTKCAAGTFRSTEVTKNYGQGVNCDTCTPGTTSSAGASSCTTCSNNAHVTSWTSGCTIKTCESAYALHNNTCVLACSSVTYQNGTTCTKKCGSGTYNRLAYSAYDGRRCSANDQSSGGSACNTQACCSSVTYQNGTTCTKKCGSGTYNRLAYSAYDGSRCSANDQSSGGSACNTQACCSSVTYQNGTTCTKKCGSGTYNRLAYSAYDGSRCSGSDQSSGGSACNTQGCCSSVTYQNGTTCTKKCGSGTYNRLAYSAYDGSRCSANDQSSGGSACNTQSCCSSVTYQNGTTCTKKCGSGTYNRLAYSAYDGSRCSGSDQSSGGSACNTQGCCSSVTYQNGSSCTKKCGSGTYNRLAYSAYDGSRCSGSDQSSGGSACNTHSCCSSVTYTQGSSCSASCGGGRYIRYAYSAYDGSRCSGNDDWNGGSCNTQSCACTVYCTSTSSCSKNRPSDGIWGVFTCSGGRTGAIESCWGRSNEKGITQCDGGALNNPPMTVCTVVNNRYSFGRTCKQGGADYIVNSLGLNGSGYPCSCN